MDHRAGNIRPADHGIAAVTELTTASSNAGIDDEGFGGLVPRRQARTIISPYSGAEQGNPSNLRGRLEDRSANAMMVTE